MPEQKTTRTPTEIFEAVLDAWENLRRPCLYEAETARDEFQRALVRLVDDTSSVVPAESAASAKEALNGPAGTGSGTVVVGWGPPGEESPIPPGGIVPGAYRVERVAASEGPDGPVLSMEIAPLDTPMTDDESAAPRAQVIDLMEALKASLAASRQKKED